MLKYICIYFINYVIMISLKDIYLFKDISPEFINFVIDNSRRMEVEAWKTILKQGDFSNLEAYIIQDWEAEVSIYEKVVKNLLPWEIFGEIALVTNEPRTATVTAKTDMILLKINQELLHKILKEFPNGSEIQKTMRDRIMENLKSKTLL